ncbi:hypothetical protein DL765_003057 [Monosporascus sp. GIB2]|nr:hypothetical protein DL765_003057 [Monosporascus sp. GIB2]
MVVLDIRMLVVAVMAYTGAQSSDDGKAIKETFITFPRAGHHIQRTEIALVSFTHPSLMTRYAMRGSLSGTGMKVFLLKWPLPWHVVNLAAWAVLAAFQGPYVPLLGRDLLPECVYYDSELSQCGDAREEEDRAGNHAAYEAAEEKRKQKSRLAKAVWTRPA